MLHETRLLAWVVKEGIPGYANYAYRTMVGAPTMKDIYENRGNIKTNAMRAALGIATVAGLGYGGYKLYDWLSPDEDEEKEDRGKRPTHASAAARRR